MLKLMQTRHDKEREREREKERKTLLGSKYLSPKLNEIGKSEQKSTDTSGKGSHQEWPPSSTNSCEYFCVFS
ncbi:hypothetical protein RUM44_011577 [Polyplax serrata]|uniref:Uncharacterized protein n=1 Tax=Polyplax serrata TaxID=468196 RepID=A0ABR1AS80_POLSC